MMPPGRRHAKAAITNNSGGYSVPRRNSQIPVPKDLRIVVGMDIDETWTNDLSISIDFPARRIRRIAHGNDLTILDAQIAIEGVRSGPVDYFAITDFQIIHNAPPDFSVCL